MLAWRNVAATESAVRRDADLGGFPHGMAGKYGAGCDERDTWPETDGQPEIPVRKPWPRFTMTELAATGASTHAGNDGGPPGTSLS